MHFKSQHEERVYNAVRHPSAFTRNFRIIKEQSWKELFDISSRNAIDFYLPDLKLAIEVHGRQHYQPTRFGGSDDIELSKEVYAKQRKRDRQLESLCWEHDISLVVISYKMLKDLKSDDDLAKAIDELVIQSLANTRNKS